MTSGMEDIVAADSAITWIDGTHGELRYRGYPIEELAENLSFEAVAYLLWNGELPGREELDRLRHELDEVRVARADVINQVRQVPATAHPLDVLRVVVSSDATTNPLTWDNTTDANRRKAIEFTAWFPTVVAAQHRLAAGQEPLLPTPGLDTAAAFLTMLYGHDPSPQQVRTLDTSLILHADHELNASTFAARVTIATQSNLHAAIASALGTLSGPRHGGASERVVAMLEEIGTPDNAESWTISRLTQKQRIMGFGHRVYRTVDPRSRQLRAMAERLLQGTPHQPWIAILDVVAEVMQREKNLYPNVDLYAALVNHELGVQPAFYSAVFAISRITGWTAHAMEQLDGRMIRPTAQYIGPSLRHVPESVGV
ncbi:MAG TPA: citrate/2-methylcitrate synthase [Chloroflexota bacterium]|nr:citrate/2-methylcitrate synthase [Chloroflexota bacterium]